MSPGVRGEQEVGSGIKDLSAVGLYKKTVGGRPVTSVMFDNVNVSSLIDTGSQVTTISETFFWENIHSNGITEYREGNWFPLTAANGLNIPYSGVALLYLTLLGHNVNQIGVLVVRDTPSVKESKRKVPAIIGMNVLDRIPGWQSIFAPSTVDMKVILVQ